MFNIIIVVSALLRVGKKTKLQYMYNKTRRRSAGARVYII